MGVAKKVAALSAAPTRPYIWATTLTGLASVMFKFPPDSDAWKDFATECRERLGVAWKNATVKWLSGRLGRERGLRGRWHVGGNPVNRWTTMFPEPIIACSRLRRRASSTAAAAVS
jgi:hypothetical protein